MGSVRPVYVLYWFWVFWGYFIPHVTDSYELDMLVWTHRGTPPDSEGVWCRCSYSDFGSVARVSTAAGTSAGPSVAGGGLGAGSLVEAAGS